MDNWQAPAGHPISVERAKVLMAGDLGDAYRSILKANCAPIYWYRVDRQAGRPWVQAPPSRPILGPA